MKKTILSAFLLLAMALAAPAQKSNDFYDDAPSRKLPGALKIEIAGEVANPGTIDLSLLPLRTLITHEARWGKEEPSFVGAYRYEGYSLLDILNDRVVQRRHSAGFRPQTDLLVAVENAAGEKALLSWGEIYFPAALHRVILAVAAAPIVPVESKENWPLPAGTKLVCANDLFSERGILNPTRITVFTAPLEIADKKGLKPLYSPTFQLHLGGKEAQPFEPAKIRAERRVMPSVFYGKGRGYHGYHDYSGILLKDALESFVTLDGGSLRRGYLIAASPDGYRIALTFSELFNRNDQAEFLLLDRGEGAEGGRWSIFPSQDFFSDRALKAVSSIHILTY